jgi:DNA mismatch repair protein MutS2
VKSPEEPLYKVGQNVRIKGQSNVGSILEVKGESATIAFGFLKTSVQLNKLEVVSKNQIKKEQKKSSYVSDQTIKDIHKKNLNFKREIDVRGMRGDEAVDTVMHFIDDAILIGMSRVRILHGKGNGILRQLIRQYLATVPNVTHYADEHVQFGGAGITVVDL